VGHFWKAPKYTYDTSSYPWTITFTYQIPSGTIPGTYGVTVLTAWGQSNSLAFQVQYGPPYLTCPPSVIRGGTITCSVGGAPAGNVTSWQFSGGGATVNGPSGTLQWSGVMVVSGTVTVAVSPYTPLSASIAVNPRTWSTQPVSATESNGAIADAGGNTYTLPVPPEPDFFLKNNQPVTYAGLAGTGYSYMQMVNANVTPVQIASGPNNGFLYYSNPVSFGTHSYQSLINSDLVNQSSTFSTAQCGTNGYISASNLLFQTRRHEYSSTTQSHWAFYSNALLANSNNPDYYLESQTAVPGFDSSAFRSAALQAIDSRINAIGAAFTAEPYAVNQSETGQFLGNINYGPPFTSNYAPCN
jgi:hypothetical protein